MKRFALAAALCISASLAAPAFAQTSTPLAECDGLPCVHLQVNGHPVTLALDTGDPPSILDTQVATDLSLTIVPMNGRDGKPMPAGFGTTEVPSMNVGGTTLQHVPFRVMPFAQWIAQGISPHVDGTLGYSVFKDRVLKLTAGKSLTLSDPIANPSSCIAGHIDLLHFGHAGPPIVTSTGFALNGHPAVMQIDTMFSGTFLIYPASEDKLALSGISKTGTKEHFPFTDGGVDMLSNGSTTQSFQSLTLATNTPVLFATQGVHEPEGLFDGTVGWPILRAHTAVFDFHNNCFDLR